LKGKQTKRLQHQPNQAGILGADELNLAEFPLALISRRVAAGQKTLEFEDEVFDQGAGRSVRRRLVISGSDRFGLPTPADSDVLLVLMQLTKQQSNFASRVLHFTRYELVELLHWHHSGASYQRLEEALQRWTSTTLYYHRAWWDRTVRRWRSRTFHVIETLDLKGADRDEPDDASSSLTWNEVLYQSFQASNLKALDLDVYFALSRPAAKQAYRFLDKRFYHSGRLEFDLKVFACEHVGLSREHDTAQLRRALEPVLKELEAVGFLEPMKPEDRYRRLGRGQCKVVLVRRPKCFRTSDEEGSLVGELLKRGVWADVAPALAKSLPEEVVQRYLALHDWLLKRKDRRIAKNPAGFLAACIANRFPFPNDFEEAKGHVERRQRDRVAGTSRHPVLPVPMDKDRQAIAAKLSALSQEEMGRLEAEALQTAKPFVARTYERLRQESGPLFQEMREALLVEYLKMERTSATAVSRVA
jgi:hypothetical protein